MYISYIYIRQFPFSSFNNIQYFIHLLMIGIYGLNIIIFNNIHTFSNTSKLLLMIFAV